MHKNVFFGRGSARTMLAAYSALLDFLAELRGPISKGKKPISKKIGEKRKGRGGVWNVLCQQLQSTKICSEVNSFCARAAVLTCLFISVTYSYK